MQKPTANRCRLRPGEWRIAALLARSRRAFVSYAEIKNELYDDDPAGGPLSADASIKVRICTMRTILRRHDVTISTHARLGYSVHASERERLGGLLESDLLPASFPNGAATFGEARP